MNVISDRLAKQYPEDDAGWGALVVPLREDIVGEVRPILLILLGAVGRTMHPGRDKAGMLVSVAIGVVGMVVVGVIAYQTEDAPCPLAQVTGSSAAVVAARVSLASWNGNVEMTRGVAQLSFVELPPLPPPLPDDSKTTLP